LPRAVGNHPWAAQLVRQQVIGLAVLGEARGSMAQHVFESLFEVTVPIIGGQKGGLVLPQVAFHHGTILDLGDPVAQGVVAILDGVCRCLYLLETALAVVVVGGDIGTIGFLAQAAIAVVGVAGVAQALQLVTPAQNK